MSSPIRRRRRSQCTLRAKALSMEALLSAEVKISRATPRMCLNCSSRSAGRSTGIKLPENIFHPGFNRIPHLSQSAFKKMISGLDADQLFRLGEGLDQRFEFSWRRVLIARPADK